MHGRVISAGRYRVGRQLSRGGMAQVRLGLDITTGHAVAVKYLCSELVADQDARRLLASEAEVTAELNHPGIVRVLDWGEETDPATGVAEPYLVMEYVAGCSMAKMLLEQKAVPASTALQLTASLLDVLAYCHDQGLVHGDVKPGNLMVLPTNEITLLDFGVARRIEASAVADDAVTPYLTIKYASPEQLQRQPVDGRSDLYSVGCVLFELLTGRPPFEGEPEQLAAQHLSDRPAAPSSYNADLSPDLDHVVLRALAKDPDDRYPSATAMSADVQGALQRVRAAAYVAPVALTPSTEPNWPLVVVLQRARQVRHRRRVRGLSAMAAAMLPIAGFGAFHLQGVGEPGTEYAAAMNLGGVVRASPGAAGNPAPVGTPDSVWSAGGTAVIGRPGALLMALPTDPDETARVSEPSVTSRMQPVSARQGGVRDHHDEEHDAPRGAAPTGDKLTPPKPSRGTPEPVGPAQPQPTTPAPKPDAPKPTAPEPNVPKPNVPKPDVPKPDVPKPDKPKPDVPKPDKPKPDKPKPDKPKDEPKPGKPKDEPKADKPKPGKPKDEPKADKPKPGKPKDEPKADKPKDEPKPDKPKDEPKPDKPKDDKPKSDKPKDDKPKDDKPKPNKP